LLGDDGTCCVYPVHPLTCRIYVSFSEPHRCDPDYINEDAVPTALLDLEEQANRILDSLHFRYRRFGDDTGLRSLLASYLSAET
jgi:Fe-S-cluster containining protein